MEIADADGPLSEQEKAQLMLERELKIALPKCSRCWQKENEHHAENLGSPSAKLPTPRARQRR